MTVITYRDGVMACDSAWSLDDTVVTRQNKITRFETGALYGAAGDSDDRTLVRLLAKVTRASEIPSRAALAEIPNDIGALFVLPSGAVFMIDTGKDDPGMCPVRHPFATVGSGKKLAFGAMAAGATAREAAAIAARYDLHCRTPVHTLTLSTRKRRK